MTQKSAVLPSMDIILGVGDKGPIGCPETSVRNYHYSMRNDPEEQSAHLRSCGRLKSLCVHCPFYFNTLLSIRTIISVTPILM